MVDAPLGALTEVDDPKENPDDEPNVGVLGACQVEPNTPPAMPLLELRDLVSEEEELVPKLEPELKGLADAEDPKIKLPEEKVAFPANPKEGDDADKEN
ncbi:hypothetical protein Gotur_021863 [Gossypium turneri]